MSKIVPCPHARFNPEFLKNLDSWLTDEELERIFFYTPEEEKALAEKKEEDRKILKPEYFDESNY